MPLHIFHVERLTPVTIRGGRAERTEGWVLVATMTTESSIWRVFDEWFETVPETEKQGGQYRVVQMSDTEHGFGTFSAHLVKPSWSVEQEWHPIPEPDPVGADVEQVA